MIPLPGVKREGASTSPPLQLDLGQLDSAVKNPWLTQAQRGLTAI